MSAKNDPLGVPDMTVPQLPEPETEDAATRTQAAPANYTPQTHATGRGMSAEPIFIDPDSTIGMAGRYALIRALAKGGMGQVAVARDTELDREVALKEIQPKFKLDAATLHRFTLEARVTGKLEHPGVVPVYGLGTYPDGRPFYAMRLLTGESLQKAIDQFHQRDALPRDPRERSMALRALLRRFIDVCNTIGYAHSRGVLHRDIKPANVMLGSFGETLVVDWGLAKEMAAPPTIPVIPQDPGKTALHQLPEFEETKEGFTLYGQTMGTPAYMSPEQAAGKWDITGIASDVYSLGAMLYAILSGSPPYSGPSFEVITRVQRGEYKPVKLVKSDVPGPLDAIVRKAMAFEIGERYVTAIALAEDVERWLADEPVSCYPEPFLTRVWRWVKRHRTLMLVGGAAGLATLVALTVGILAVNAQRKRTLEAKNEAVESRAEAREALLALTDDAVGEVLAGSQKPTPQQAQFLDRLIDMYSRFAKKEPESPATKLFIAGAHYRIGRIEARVERYGQASDAYSRAAEQLRDPEVAELPEARRMLGEVRLYEGVMALQQGKSEAEARLREAIAIFQPLADADAKSELRYRLSQAEDRLGTFYAARRRYKDAEPLFRSSLQRRQKLAEEAPDHPEYQFRLAQSFRQIADIELHHTGQTAQGLENVAKARAVVERLLKANPTSAAFLALYADIDTFLTAHYTASRRIDPKRGVMAKDSPAVFHARQAARTWATLVNLNPGDSKFRQRQAEANVNLARQCMDHAQPREGLYAVETALAILRDLDQDSPNDVATQTKLLQAIVAEVTALRVLGDERAVDASNDAVQTAEGLAARQPAHGEIRQHAATARLERALLRLNAGMHKDARVDLDAAWPHLEAAARAGNSVAVSAYARAVADWMKATDDYTEAPAYGKKIASLPLPQGQGWCEAACFHTGVADRLLKSPDLDAAWEKFANNQIGESVHCLAEAVKNGFDRADWLINEPDLSQARRTNEFQTVLDALQTRGKPGRIEN